MTDCRANTNQELRDLHQATRAFEPESVKRSWWYVISAFVLLAGTLSAAGLVNWWPLRTVLAILGALLMVRVFITFHDFMHGAILRGSRIASVVFSIYGCLGLTPPRSWNKSHNYHHSHVGRITPDSIGAFPVITTRMWREASLVERVSYRSMRHPLTLLFGYVTVFAFSICLLPLLRDPVAHWDSALSLLAHGGLITALWLLGGFDTAFFVVLLPMTAASMLGSYIFFAQHNFEGMQIASADSWSFPRAALRSSSYLHLNSLLRWFTGNIGFHHIHHLNVRVPFYRLPDAMASIPGLQAPVTLSLSPRDMLGCLRSNLWDEATQRMVSYRQAGRTAASEPRPVRPDFSAT